MAVRAIADSTSPAARDRTTKRPSLTWLQAPIIRHLCLIQPLTSKDPTFTLTVVMMPPDRAARQPNFLGTRQRAAGAGDSELGIWLADGSADRGCAARDGVLNLGLFRLAHGDTALTRV